MEREMTRSMLYRALAFIVVSGGMLGGCRSAAAAAPPAELGGPSEDAARTHAASLAGAVTPAYSFEWNDAVAGSLPDTDLACVWSEGSEVCIEAYGDKIYVKDIKADGASAVARWFTDYGRWGTCRNALGAGKWGVCDKDFKENHILTFRAAQYDGDTGQYVGNESGPNSAST
jgi:hypothetical protein